MLFLYPKFFIRIFLYFNYVTTLLLLISFFGNILLSYFAEDSEVHSSPFSILTIERCHHSKRMRWNFACLTCMKYEQVWSYLLICVTLVKLVVSQCYLLLHLEVLIHLGTKESHIEENIVFYTLQLHSVCAPIQ